MPGRGGSLCARRNRPAHAVEMVTAGVERSARRGLMQARVRRACFRVPWEQAGDAVPRRYFLIPLGLLFAGCAGGDTIPVCTGEDGDAFERYALAPAAAHASAHGGDCRECIAGSLMHVEGTGRERVPVTIAPEPPPLSVRGLMEDSMPSHGFRRLAGRRESDRVWHGTGTSSCNRRVHVILGGRGSRG